jgi:hypothetical protein
LGNLQSLVLALVLAGLVLAAAAGLIPAPFAFLVSFAMPLPGPVRRLGGLLAGGLVAMGSTPGTSRPGGWGLAARRPRGQRRLAGTPWRRQGRAWLGVLHGQAEGNSDEGPEHCPDHDQLLAAMAKRSIHRASKVEYVSA